MDKTYFVFITIFGFWSLNTFPLIFCLSFLTPTYVCDLMFEIFLSVYVFFSALFDDYIKPTLKQCADVVTC